MSALALEKNLHKIAGNIQAAALHTQTLSQLPLAELSAKPQLLLTTPLARHIPGLSGMVQGIPVSLPIQGHKHQGRTLTMPFPKSAASSYQNLQDRPKEEVHRIKQRPEKSNKRKFTVVCFTFKENGFSSSKNKGY